MNVFEDLIEELKEENLLEETVIKTTGKVQATDFNPDKTADDDNSSESSAGFDFVGTEVAEEKTEENGGFENNEKYLVESEEIQDADNYSEVETVEQSVFEEEQQAEIIEQPKTQTPLQQINQVEFFKNRASNEVMCLQLVDNVLAGVEREVLNVAPKLYDEVSVKKALHEFLQISSQTHTPEHAQAEFLLMQETESWYSALTQRDKNIKVSQLRRFCENSRPALSGRALTAMARFYRNAPFTESVRNKFDLVLTRLFSRETEKDRRTLSFSREELITQISDLYAEWSSVPLYSMDEDDSEIVLAEMKIEDFMNEAEQAVSFDELVRNDFFNRLHIFKESTQENFFAPRIAAAVVEANIRIGNCYVELFEKQTDSVEVLEEKYGSLHERIISEVICKSLDINELLEKTEVKNLPVKPHSPNQNTVVQNDGKTQTSETENNSKKTKKGKSKLFSVNKWLLALTVLTIVATVGLYFWVQTIEKQEVAQGNVKNVNLENSSLKEHIQTARISSDTFYGIVTPSWDSLSREQKESFLGKILAVGAEKGFVRVDLINKKGKTVGYAAPDRVEILNP